MSKTSNEQSNKKLNKMFKCMMIIISVCVCIICVFLGYLKFNDKKIDFTDGFKIVNQKKLIDVEKSVVKIYCYDKSKNIVATGSGFIAFDNQTVVTNYHVLKHAYNMEIETESGKIYTIKEIINYKEEQDLAILKVSEITDLVPLEFRETDDLEKGDKIIAVGSPLGLFNTVSEGIVSGKREEAGMQVIQISAAISEGSSGGALFDSNYNVVGVTYAKYESGENLNMAIPISLVQELFNSDFSGSTEIEALYFENNPIEKYINASEYKEMPAEVLYQRSKDYDKMKVKIVLYYSSNIYDFPEESSESYYTTYNRIRKDNKLYISKENVTGDYGIDQNNHMRDGVISIAMRDVKYSDEPFEVGEAVDVYGILVWEEGLEGEPGWIDLEEQVVVKHKE